MSQRFLIPDHLHLATNTADADGTGSIHSGQHQPDLADALAELSKLNQEVAELRKMTAEIKELRKLASEVTELRKLASEVNELRHVLAAINAEDVRRVVSGFPVVNKAAAET
jgi:protein subunit release factor A